MIPLPREAVHGALIVVGLHMGAYYGLWLIGGLCCWLGWVPMFCPHPLP